MVIIFKKKSNKSTYQTEKKVPLKVKIDEISKC